MSWQILITIYIILYSVSVVLQRLILKGNESKPAAYTIFFSFLTGILVGIIGFFSSDMSFPQNIGSLMGNLILMTLLYGFANLLIFKSLKETEASKFTILFATRAFFTAAASSLVLKEFLSGEQWLGAFLIFSGVILVNLRSVKFQFSKGELFASVAAIAVGVANTNDRFLLGSFNVPLYITTAYISTGLLIAVLYPRELKNIKIFFNPKMFRNILVISLISVFSSITFFAALQLAKNSSQVASLSLTSVIVTVLISVIFLKERDNLVKLLIASVLSFVGLLMLV